MISYILPLGVGILAFIAGWFVGGHNAAAVAKASEEAAALDTKVNELKGKL